MATLNPLEQKARSSFIKGMLIAMLLGLLVAAALGYKIYDFYTKEKERKAQLTKVYILNKSVLSGQIITQDMLKQVEVDKQTVPAEAQANSFSNLSALNITDEQGNPIEAEADDNGNVDFNKLVITVSNNGNKAKYELEQDGNGYKYAVNGQTIHVTTQEVPFVAKIDLGKNTVLSSSMISRSDDITTNDLREQEYNMITLPSDLQDGDTIDIRIRLITGEDFIVTSKKIVKIPETGEGLSADTIILKLSEGEILTLDCAIIDSYKMQGSKLYATKYIEAGEQSKLEVNYIPSDQVRNLITDNSNIVAAIKNNYTDSYTNRLKYYRAKIDSLIESSGTRQNVDQEKVQEEYERVESGVATEKSKQDSQRQAYLESLQN